MNHSSQNRRRRPAHVLSNPVAYDYDLHPQHGLVLIRGAGPKWTGRDILESAEEIVTDDRFSPGYDWVYDVRFVHQTVITTDEMERIVEQFRLYQEKGQVASTSRSVIVGTDDDLRFSGTLYQHKRNRPDDQFTIVHTLEEAWDWLGIEDPASELPE